MMIMMVIAFMTPFPSTSVTVSRRSSSWLTQPVINDSEQHSSALRLDGPLAVRFRVSLVDIDSAVWRRLLVPRDRRLGQIHHVVRAALDRQSSHPYE
jgi:hypothetical protein